MILGIDSGNYMVKVCGDRGVLSFISTIGEAREINLKQKHGEDDMYFEYEGKKGFAGTLALYESEFCGSIMGGTKNHTDNKTRVLLGIHRYLTKFNLRDNQIQIVVGQPISMHNEDEKSQIRDMLTGKHTISVNGVEKTFWITSVIVAAEGGSAYWSGEQKDGLIRLIDVGSGTVNCCTILDSRFIDRESETLNFGANTTKTKDTSALARGIATHTLKKWNRDDEVYVVGGAAEDIAVSLQHYFNNLQILYPVHNDNYFKPVYANAIAFYNIGVNVYE
jgi:plasmid segregation protein ParM